MRLNVSTDQRHPGAICTGQQVPDPSVKVKCSSLRPGPQRWMIQRHLKVVVYEDVPSLLGQQRH